LLPNLVKDWEGEVVSLSSSASRASSVLLSMTILKRVWDRLLVLFILVLP
jgi:hypothetical protein